MQKNKHVKIIFQELKYHMYAHYVVNSNIRLEESLRVSIYNPKSKLTRCSYKG